MSKSLPAEGTNGLLELLPDEDREAVLNRSTYCLFQLGEGLLAANRRSEFAYFPTTCVVSFLRTLSDGTTIEVGLVGSEGVVGIDQLLDEYYHPNSALIQGAGSAWRIGATELNDLFHERPALNAAVLRFTSAFIIQLTQTAACNRLHDLQSRLARWLLMMDDRVDDGEVRLTQEFVSHMLGVRTAGVSEAVQTFEKLGVIGHRRQLITITNRSELEKLACECYETVRREYERRLKSSAA